MLLLSFISVNTIGLAKSGAPAQIIAQGPLDFCIGDSLKLQTVGHDTTATFQWFYNGAGLPGANDSCLYAKNGGSYTCLITDKSGPQLSNTLKLTTRLRPMVGVILSGSVPFCQGDSAKLDVSQLGAYDYSWYKDGVPTGVSSSSIWIHSAGRYYCAISNGNCVVNSDTVHISTVMRPIAFVSFLTNDTLCIGDTILLRGHNTSGALISWLKNGALIPGESDSILKITTNGFYQLILDNSICADTSNNSQAVFIPNPSAQSILLGPSFIFSGDSSEIRARSSNGVNFRWFLNGISISGSHDSVFFATQNGSYFCVVDNGSCADTSSTVNITVVNQSTARINNSGPLSFCLGDSVILSAFPSPNFSYQWRRNGLPISGAQVSRFTAKSSGSYSCLISLPGGSNRLSNVLAVIAITPPTATISPAGNVSICAGENLVASAGTGPSIRYDWMKNGSIIQSGAAANILINSSGVYQVIMIRMGCADTSASLTVNVIAPPLASVSPIGPINKCIGETQSLTEGSSIPGYSFQWYRNGVLISGAINQSFNSSQTGLYHVVVKSVNCADTSNAVQVNFDPVPIANIQAGSQTTFCSGDFVDLTVQTQTGYNLQWQKNGTNIPAATNSVLRVDSTGNYRCIVSQGICRDTSQIINVKVSILPQAIVTPSGPTTFFTGDSVILSAPGGFSYQWFKDNLPLPGITTKSIIVKSSGQYKVIVYNQGCNDTSSNLQVTVIPGSSTNIVAGGATTFCNGDSVILLATFDLTYSYQWKRNALTIPGANANRYLAKVSGSYTCEITISGNTQTSNSIIVTVKPNPVAFIVANGSLSFCLGDSLEINARSGPGYSFAWYKNGQLVPGLIDSLIYVKTGGNYQVVTSLNGCISSSNVLSTSVTPPPNSIIFSSGPTTFFQGDSVRLIANSSSGVAYSWLRNGTVVVGANLFSLTVKISGIYICVQELNGCSDSSNTIMVNVIPSGTLGITAKGPTSFCMGDSVLLEATFDTGYTYQWIKDGIQIPGETRFQYKAWQNGNYTCDITSFGSTRTSNSITVTVSTPPIANIISTGATVFFEGNSVNLIANAGVSLTYQWLRNGSPLLLDTVQTYNASQSGQFRCIVANNGCADSSQNIEVVVIPLAQLWITHLSDTTVCNGDTVELKANYNPYLTYQWRRNGTISFGAIDTTLKVWTSGTYTCEFRIASSSIASRGIIVTVHSKPQALIFPVGQTELCPGDSSSLSANFGVNYKYSWLKSGVPLNNTNRFFWVKESGDYQCAFDNFGCLDTSTIHAVQIKSEPEFTLIEDQVFACLNERVQFEPDSLNALWKYLWKNSAGVSVGSEPVFSFSASSSDDFILTITDTNSSCSTNKLAKLTLKPKSSVSILISDTVFLAGDPVVVRDLSIASDSLSIDYGDGSSTTIAAGSNAIHRYDSLGIFTLRFISCDSFNCPDTSYAKIRISEFLPNNFNVIVYPNPSSDGIFNIRLLVEEGDELIVTAYSSDGKAVISQNVDFNSAGLKEIPFDLGAFANGVYLLEMKYNNEVLNRNSLEQGPLDGSQLKYFKYSRLIKLN